ncbi:hypothetical protein ACH5RR_015108 [Cinchona calisaya]|uniref:RING-type E3 ubiquitin transferase n=1 Tax=Cinchona calisaya TaxID=153742 RepID=A0ABD2ZT00_9GENT
MEIRLILPLFPKYPPYFPKSVIAPFLLLLTVLISSAAAAAAAENPSISYSQYCNDVVPEIPLSPFTHPFRDSASLTINYAHFTYTTRENAETTPSRFNRLPNNLLFITKSSEETQDDAVFKLKGALDLRGFQFQRHFRNYSRRGLRLVHYRPPRIPVDSLGYRAGFHGFAFHGFWNSTSGKLCMVGQGNEGRYRYFFGVFKVNYSNKSSIFDSFVNGTLELLNADGKFVESLSILGVNSRKYEFKLIDKEIEKNVFKEFDHLSGVSLGLNGTGEMCDMIRKNRFFELEYKSDCESENCDVLHGEKGNFTLPRSLIFDKIECSESGFVRNFMIFGSSEVRLGFEPNATLVAEGKWDGEKKRLDMVGCRILDGAGTVGDCSVRLSLRFPLVYTMRQRNFIVGELWSSKSLNESGYFGRGEFGNWIRRSAPTGLRYEYDEIENVKRSCARKMIQGGKVGKFPEALSRDMTFSMLVRNRKGDKVFGYCFPLFVGDKYFAQGGLIGEVESTGLMNYSQSNLVNVSFELSFQPLSGLSVSSELSSFGSVKISAEGIYDSKIGHLCMVGCMHVPLRDLKIGRNSSLDCEILVDIQYAPVNAKVGNTIKGTIESMRMKSDPLYFEPFEIVSQSLYSNQAKDSLWTMDLEMTIVLVSSTLTCIFVGLQLFDVQKHPNVLPFISVIMLTVLTLAHMIPLLLNFEALFLTNRNRQNVYLGSDGWLEVNEVLVRVITMVAFLLEFRLLQLTWSAKAKDASQKILWISEKKVLYLCLPLYLAGGLISWFAHLSSRSHGRALRMMQHIAPRQPSIWEDLKSYAGLILDGFLFPQVLFNLFCNTQERALAPSYYVGTTLVRLLPHVYDLYRAHSSVLFALNKIYANPKIDYYSTAWDVIICGVGLLLALLIFLQQRFGGRCFLPKRFRQNLVYERVPVVGTDTE